MESILAMPTNAFLSKPYTLVILGNLLIAIELLVFMYIYVIKQRLGTFKKKFMETNGFNKLHKEAFSQNAPDLGYPDTGSGRYSKKLPYKEWYAFNCSQRVYMNYIEGFALVVVASLLAGIAYPLITFGLQLLYVVGRFIYSQGYMKGADYRIAGAVLYQVS